MKNSVTKIISALLLLSLLTALLSACITARPVEDLPELPSERQEPQQPTEPDIPDEPEIPEDTDIPDEPEIPEIEKDPASVRIDGSTSTIPLEIAVRMGYYGETEEEATKNAVHSTTYGALYGLIDGDTDLLLISLLSDRQRETLKTNRTTVEEIPISREAFVFIVNADNPVDELTEEQIRDIYSGKITNWKEVGGNDQPIAAYRRNADSGSQTYMELFMGDTPFGETVSSTVYSSMSDIIDAVALYDNAENAIGYSVYSYAAQMYANAGKVKFIKVNGVAPTLETMGDLSYPLLNCNYAVYNKKTVTPEILALVEWILSDEGQSTLANAGYVPLNGGSVADLSGKDTLFKGVGTGKVPENATTKYYYTASIHYRGNGGLSVVFPETFPASDRTFTYMEEDVPLILGITYRLDCLTDKTLESKINDFISKSCQELEGDLDAITKIIEEGNEGTEYSPYGYNVWYDMDRDQLYGRLTDVSVTCKNGYISVVVTSEYSNLDFSPNYSMRAVTYDMRTGEEIELSDLFPEGVDFSEQLNQSVRKAIEDTTADEFVPEINYEFVALTQSDVRNFTCNSIYIHNGSSVSHTGFWATITGGTLADIAYNMDGMFVEATGVTQRIYSNYSEGVAAEEAVPLNEYGATVLLPENRSDILNKLVKSLSDYVSPYIDHEILLEEIRKEYPRASSIEVAPQYTVTLCADNYYRCSTLLQGDFAVFDAKGEYLTYYTKSFSNVNNVYISAKTGEIMTDWTEILSPGWQANSFVLQTNFSANNSYEQKYTYGELMTKPELFSPDLEMKDGKPWLVFRIKDYSPKEAGSINVKERDGYSASYSLYADIDYTPFGDLPEKASLTMDGSTSTIPLEVGIRTGYMGQSKEDAKKSTLHSTTYDSFNNLITYRCDIIFTTPISDTQKQAAAAKGIELTEIPICMEGFVFFVNVDNPVEELSVQQLKDIYSGKITNWKEVGGADEPILAYQRNFNSGSQNYMMMFMGDTPLADPVTSTIVTGMQNVIDAVAVYDNGINAIGYSVYSYAANMYANAGMIKFIKVNGIAPTPDTLGDLTYPLLNYNYAVYDKSNEDPAIEKLVAWLLSDQGQQAITYAGYVPLKGGSLPQYVGASDIYRDKGTGGSIHANADRTSTYHWHIFPELTYDAPDLTRSTTTFTSTNDLPALTGVSYRTSAIKDSTLSDNVHAFIDEACAELEAETTEFYSFLDALNVSKENAFGNDFYTVEATRIVDKNGVNHYYKQPINIKISAVNGYLSVALTLRFYSFGQDMPEHIYDCRTAVFDLRTGKRVSRFSDLFVDGYDVETFANDRIRQKMLVGWGDYGEDYLMKDDFTALTREQATNFTVNSILLTAKNSVFTLGMECPYEPYAGTSTMELSFDLSAMATRGLPYGRSQLFSEASQYVVEGSRKLITADVYLAVPYTEDEALLAATKYAEATVAEIFDEVGLLDLLHSAGYTEVARVSTSSPQEICIVLHEGNYYTVEPKHFIYYDLRDEEGNRISFPDDFPHWGSPVWYLTDKTLSSVRFDAKTGRILE